MIESYKRDALVRLKTVRGHLDAVLSMVESDRYCPELMKQIAALQASLEKVNRLLLRNHLETCVSEAIQTGKGREKIDELMEALRFNSSLTDFRQLADVLTLEPTAADADEVPSAAPLEEVGGLTRPRRQRST
ncbi:MAG TPA: metal-sensitive transcriptional regulator [Candidatus Dormibacteraeota bacterium]|nr:metal-sensitive transcriptional regulator [Candidatus Dormibacteraeota bacterium]